MAPLSTTVPSTAARPAEKRTTTEVDPALVRRTVTAMVKLSEADGQPMRRQQARQIVVAYASGEHGPELDGWSHWLRNWLGIKDPTAASAIRNVKREGR